MPAARPAARTGLSAPGPSPEPAGGLARLAGVRPAVPRQPRLAAAVPPGLSPAGPRRPSTSGRSTSSRCRTAGSRWSWSPWTPTGERMVKAGSLIAAACAARSSGFSLARDTGLHLPGRGRLRLERLALRRPACRGAADLFAGRSAAGRMAGAFRGAVLRHLRRAPDGGLGDRLARDDRGVTGWLRGADLGARLTGGAGASSTADGVHAASGWVRRHYVRASAACTAGCCWPVSPRPAAWCGPLTTAVGAVPRHGVPRRRDALRLAAPHGRQRRRVPGWRGTGCRSWGCTRRSWVGRGCWLVREAGLSSLEGAEPVGGACALRVRRHDLEAPPARDRPGTRSRCRRHRRWRQENADEGAGLVADADDRPGRDRGRGLACGVALRAGRGRSPRVGAVAVAVPDAGLLAAQCALALPLGWIAALAIGRTLPGIATWAWLGSGLASIAVTRAFGPAVVSCLDGAGSGFHARDRSSRGGDGTGLPLAVRRHGPGDRGREAAAPRDRGDRGTPRGRAAAAGLGPPHDPVVHRRIRRPPRHRPPRRGRRGPFEALRALGAEEVAAGGGFRRSVSPSRRDLRRLVQTSRGRVARETPRPSSWNERSPSSASTASARPSRCSGRSPRPPLTPPSCSPRSRAAGGRWADAERTYRGVLDRHLPMAPLDPAALDRCATAYDGLVDVRFGDGRPSDAGRTIREAIDRLPAPRDTSHSALDATSSTPVARGRARPVRRCHEARSVTRLRDPAAGSLSAQCGPRRVCLLIDRGGLCAAASRCPALYKMQDEWKGPPMLSTIPRVACRTARPAPLPCGGPRRARASRPRPAEPVPDAVTHRRTAIPDRIIRTFAGDPARSIAVTWRTDAGVAQGDGPDRHGRRRTEFPARRRRSRRRAPR